MMYVSSVQVQNLHSCVQVINDFVSPEHVMHSFHLTQELRSSKEEINYEDKLQVEWKYHSMSAFIGILRPALNWIAECLICRSLG